MKRDMDLIRKILLEAEVGQSKFLIDGYSNDEIKYHQALVIEAGLAEGAILRLTEIPASVTIHKLTWAGHDFVEAISSESNWQRVKDFLKDAGKQLTLETAKVAIGQLFQFG